MLSNSPGGVNFESAPFKLTRELLEVYATEESRVLTFYFYPCYFIFWRCWYSFWTYIFGWFVLDHGFWCWRSSKRVLWLFQSNILFTEILFCIWTSFSILCALCFFISCLQVLCIQGFLTCRKHAERIILLVEMLQVAAHIQFQLLIFIHV